MIRFPAGFDGGDTIKRYLDYYQPSYGVMMLSAGQTPAFSPLSLFSAGEPGAWYDPSDLSTMFQDDAGLTPVTAAGQAVGRILDKSGRGNHLTQATPAARPVLQQDANGRWYLNNDGVDDVLFGSLTTMLVGPWEFWAAVNITTGSAAAGNNGVFSKTGASSGLANSVNSEGLFQRSDGVNRQIMTASRIASGTSYVATLTAAFTINTAFVARGTAETGPDQLRTTTPNGSTTLAAAYTGTPGTTGFRIGHGAASAVFRFYGGLAIDRALTASEATNLDTWLKQKMAL